MPKLSKQNQPVLDMLHRNKLDKVKIIEKDLNFFDSYNKTFIYYWRKYNEQFKENIFVVSNTFAEAVNKSRNKLLEINYDIIKNNKEDNIIKGTIVFNNMIYMIYQRVEKDNDDVCCIFFIFSKDGTPLGLDILEYDVETDKTIKFSWLSKAIEIRIKAQCELLTQYLLDCTCIFMFKRYAEVETKILLPHSKSKNNNIKYINETDIKVTYLDSKWFTNLVKSDAFKVSGHFRLQPYKNNGSWDKKLIYINDFEKSGYISKAKILINNLN